MSNPLRSAIVVFAFLALISGVLYPLVVTGIGSALFAAQASGSLLSKGGHTVGSALVGQHFDQARYFWGRPSATSGHPYNAAASGGSNQGPLNPALLDAVKQRIAALRAADPTDTTKIPVDLVTASASGLDPHISRAAADYQAARIARARGIDDAQIRALIEQHTSPRWLGLFGEPTVHVLRLNTALDDMIATRGS